MTYLTLSCTSFSLSYNLNLSSFDPNLNQKNKKLFNAQVFFQNPKKTQVYVLALG
jgi:hypothetical protein